MDHVVQCTYTETSNSQRTLHGILSLLLVKDLLSADPKKATKVCNETYHDYNKKFMPDEIVILLEVWKIKSSSNFGFLRVDNLIKSFLKNFFFGTYTK